VIRYLNVCVMTFLVQPIFHASVSFSPYIFVQAEFYQYNAPRIILLTYHSPNSFFYFITPQNCLDTTLHKPFCWHTTLQTPYFSFYFCTPYFSIFTLLALRSRLKPKYRLDSRTLHLTSYHYLLCLHNQSQSSGPPLPCYPPSSFLCH